MRFLDCIGSPIPGFPVPAIRNRPQGKKKKGKDKGKKKKKDPTADRSIESLFAELASHGIIEMIPKRWVRGSGFGDSGIRDSGLPLNQRAMIP